MIVLVLLRHGVCLSACGTAQRASGAATAETSLPIRPAALLTHSHARMLTVDRTSIGSVRADGDARTPLVDVLPSLRWKCAVPVMGVNRSAGLVSFALGAVLQLALDDQSSRRARKVWAIETHGNRLEVDGV